MGVVVSALVLSVGLAVDLGNLYMAKTKLQAAVDSAALAGSLELPYDPDVSNGRVVAAVNAMLEKNYPDAEVESITSGSDIRSVNVLAKANVSTLLMGVAGITDKWISAKASAGFNKLEVVFVVDNSGSMKGTPINMVRAAALNLVDLILPDGADPGSKVGLVPFKGTVRLQDDVQDGLPAGCRNWDGSEYTGMHEDFMPMYWALPDYYRNWVTLDTCSGIPKSHGLTGDKYAITQTLNRMDAQGVWSGTIIPMGMKWGRLMLTPGAPYPQAGDPEEYRKILILLTDGDNEDGGCGGRYAQSYEPNNYWTNAYYGMGVDSAHCEDGGQLNSDMLEQAQLAKDSDIEIFTIRFGNSDTTDVALMKQIASSKPGTDDHYFDAPSVYDIDDVFKKIGRHLGWRLLN
jgi:hypothetical protein